MSLFGGGPECSTAANPLGQFTKHVQDDTSLQRDRLIGQNGSPFGESMRSQSVSHDAMLDDFLQASAHVPATYTPQPFAMDMLRQELENTQQVPRQSSAWHMYEPSSSTAQIQQPRDNAEMSLADFRAWNSRQNTAHASSSNVSQARAEYRPSMGPVNRPFDMNGMTNMMGMSTGMGMGVGMNYGSSMGMGMGMNYSRLSSDTDKGKSRMVELDDKDWESHFAQLEQHAGVEADIKDDTLNDTETDHFGDFESIWRGIKAENANQPRDDWQDWANGTYDSDGMLDQDAAMGDYLFEAENPLKDHHDPFEQGQQIMSSGGNLSLAALAFEAAVQRDPSHVAAWTALGQAQAQNEKETPAIRAMEQALKLDPSNLDALLALAVSYTNEGYESTAYRTLERWVTTKYPDLAPTHSSPNLSFGTLDREKQHESITSLFVRAAQKSPSGTAMDPDVQVGLGVLFYAAEDFEKAVDCFSAALTSTQLGSTNSSSQLHLLYNRLGATLANSGRSEEAVDAYERALAHRQNFVRARYNLGVSCINMGCLEQAAQELLGALAMHRVVEAEGLESVRRVMGDGVDGQGYNRDQVETMIRQNESTNLFDTLRRVFAQLERRDLRDLVGPGMDLDVFRREGFLLDR